MDSYHEVENWLSLAKEQNVAFTYGRKLSQFITFMVIVLFVCSYVLKMM